VAKPLTAEAAAERQQQLEDARDDSEKDADALRRYLMYAFWLAVAVVSSYFAREYAKKRIGFSQPDSTYVNVTSRGKPSLGGPFVLVNTDGEVVSQAEFTREGVFTLFYFGFVRCPEICPIELNRMTKVVDMVEENFAKRAAAAAGDTQPGAWQRYRKKMIQPLFISCDPRRDSLAEIKEYLSVFHPRFMGLVGTPKQVDAACKSYRVYYSMPDAEAEKESDYLIDHSISIFLFDPKGRFVDFFGSRYDHNEITEKVCTYIGEYTANPDWTNY
jgi:protein SCO1/2